MNLNITHKAENYEDVSGSKRQFNAFAAQRLRVLNEAISGKVTAHRQNISTFYLHTCLYTQIYVLMEYSLKKSTGNFYISNPGCFSLR